jgi:hypothetical protein
VDIICYRNTVNRASAFTHFTSWSILSDYNITGIFGFVVFALGALFTKGLLSRVVVFVFGVLCIAFAVFPFVVPEHISPASHYSWRILIIVMPSALSACVLFVKAPGFDAALSDRFWTKLRVLGSGLVLVVAVWQVGVTREWCGFLTTMADDLGHRRGVVKYWESIAVVPSVGRQTVGQFAFSWTVPYTGALAGALENGRVSAIVASPPGYWYPRGESVEAEMDMLSEFQIVVDSVFMQDLHGANK